MFLRYAVLWTYWPYNVEFHPPTSEVFPVFPPFNRLYFPPKNNPQNISLPQRGSFNKMKCVNAVYLKPHPNIPRQLGKQQEKNESDKFTNLQTFSHNYQAIPASSQAIPSHPSVFLFSRIATPPTKTSSFFRFKFKPRTFAFDCAFCGRTSEVSPMVLRSCCWLFGASGCIKFPNAEEPSPLFSIFLCSQSNFFQRDDLLGWTSMPPIFFCRHRVSVRWKKNLERNKTPITQPHKGVPALGSSWHASDFMRHLIERHVILKRIEKALLLREQISIFLCRIQPKSNTIAAMAIFFA